MLHNTILTNQNQRLSIELRFNTSGSDVQNNLSDADIGNRNGAAFSQNGNITNANTSLFLNPTAGDLHLLETATNAINQVVAPADALRDYNNQIRPAGNEADVGADEFSPTQDLTFGDGFDG